ncbi:hypothetical protein Pcinc_030842 [Petrolisthes cinctipes]|uniref:Uncharacterized protein n=1 Tax=Petrolisthes cinctipes TaxID=88211 RepID=A0AAE1K3K7_PETCI|nr:hypothetical protein Pcinc_030842 [Petrolisthes cinctipes]
MSSGYKRRGVIPGKADTLFLTLRQHEGSGLCFSFVAVACGSPQLLGYPGMYGSYPWSYFNSNLGSLP